MFSALIEQLIQALRCLPGVGPKTAQRMAFHLLQHRRENGLHLANILQQTLQEVGHCKKCHILSETLLCQLCTDSRRDTSSLCVVGSPADVVAFEQAGNFKGLYFVLMGHLSPLDGIGPKEIGIPIFEERLQDSALQEIILANSTTVEGEATAYYIANIAQKKNIKCSRIAFGVPVGGELEYLGFDTLARAFAARTNLS